MDTTITSPNRGSTSTGAGGIDPRGPRFTAAVTVIVLAAVLLVAPGPLAVGLLGVQLALFVWATVAGVHRTPHAWVFRTLIKPRLNPPAELEDPRPPRFAQGVGAVFTAVALAGYLANADVVGAIATGFALIAATLNAVFNLCLGCELYLLFKRIGSPARSWPHIPHHPSTKSAITRPSIDLHNSNEKEHR